MKLPGLCVSWSMERRGVKKRILLVGLLATIAALVCLACLFLPTDKEVRHIILISIDTIRADHVSSYGYQYKTTPRIDAFADNAVLFENCFSNIPLTLPAHSSMLTGVIPPTHGVQDNLSMALSDSVLTLPEILQVQGYATYGIISADVLNKRYGLDQGFDVYDDTFGDEAGKSEMVPQRFADETAAHALEWLEENREKKKFMFIHFYDPHTDYTPPAPYDKQFKHPYDGEIAFVDDCIGRIIDKLKSLDLYDDSLIIITGDHAELLNEHGEPTHGFFIYQNVLRVPLIIKPVGHSSRTRVADNTSLTDIVPTILGQSGIEIPPHIQGVDLSDYFVRRNHHIPDRYIFNECLTATKYKGNSLLGVINNQWHYIQTTRPELYNRIEDPHELNNLIGRQPHRGRILQDQLSRILEASVETRNESAAVLNYESRKALESLGYVSGAVDSNLKFDRDREDPKDLLKIHNDLQHILTLTHDEKFDEVIKLCNEIITQRPDIAPTYELLADIYIKLESYDEAIHFAKKKLALLPEDIDSLKFLAQTYSLAEDYPQAIDYINTILKMNPDDVGAYRKLADNHLKLKSYDKAIEAMEKRLALLGEDVEALKFLAETHNLAGNYPEAIDYINIILKLKGDDADAYGKLAGVYLKLKSYDKAIDAMQKRLSLLPEDVGSVKFLAEACYLAGNYRQAVDYVNTILKLEGDAAETYYYRARNYHRLDDAAGALQDYLKVLQLDPNYLPARIDAADIYEKTGKLKDAVEHYEIALKQNQDLAFKHNTVAWIQATQKDPEVYNPESALVHAEKAVELARDENARAHVYYPHFLDTLAVAQSANGQFDAAIETAGLALKLCRERELVSEAEEIAERLELYRRGETYRE